MKNSNLLNRLLSYSHEKQSPQRFARYAAMLIMLLTLGVGQMWADEKWYNVGVAASNPNNYTMKVGVTAEGWSWYTKDMDLVENFTFEGNKLYLKAINTDKSKQVIGQLKFQLYDGSTHKGEVTPIAHWTATDANTIDNMIYNYGSPAWYTKLTFSTSARFYFDASGWSQTTLKLWIGHVNYQGFYSLTNITNTKLYYGNPGATWGDAMGIGVVGGTSDSDGGHYPTTTISNSSEYTGWKNYALSSYGDNQVYLMVNNGKAGQTPSMHYYGTHYNTDALNSTQTIKYAVSTNGATPAELGSGDYVPANIAISSYKFSDRKYNAVDESSGSVTLSKDGSNYSATVTAARTATTTYTVSNIDDDYTFLGWYSAASGGEPLETDETYTFYPTAATTVYARFSHENNHTVTISRYCTSTSSEISRTSQKVGEISSAYITAPEIAGYAFAGWTIGAGLTNLSSGTGSNINPIEIKTKADNDDYTLTANYTEVLTTDWKLIGDNYSGSPFGDNYTYSSGKAMSKAHGASATDKAYYDLVVTKVGTWYFKVATANDNDHKYGWGNNSDYKEFKRADNGSLKDVYTGNQNPVKFTPDGLGEYAFEVDYTNTPCSVKVTFPTNVDVVTYGKGTGGNTVTATYSGTEFSSGTKVERGKTVTFTQTAQTGYTFRDWYTTSSGTGGTQLSTDATYNRTVSSSNNVYAIYTINNHDISYTAPSNGSYTITVGNESAVSEDTDADYNQTITLAATANDGYHFNGWTVTKAGGGSVTVSSNQFSMPDDNVTVAASFVANDYTVTFNKNGGSGDTMESESFTYGTSKNLTTNTYTRTGYTFQGWATSQGDADAGTVTYNDGVAGHLMDAAHNSTVELFAVWQANPYTVTLDYDETGLGSAGEKSSVSATYDAAMPAMGTAPVGAAGYKFRGYFTGHNGGGTKYYDADGSSARAWNIDGNTTLYAYFEKAEIATLPLSATFVHPWVSSGTMDSITVTPTLTFTPEPTVLICYEIQYSDGSAVTDDGLQTFRNLGSNSIRFRAPKNPGSYRVHAELKTTNCSGEVLDTKNAEFAVAGDYSVTVKYVCDGKAIRDQEVLTINSLDSTSVTAPAIARYTFARWSATAGITSSSPENVNPKNFVATYDGVITAEYTETPIVYFKNNLNWGDVYVTYDAYWNSDKGTGNNGKIYHHMTHIEGTDIWYDEVPSDFTNNGYANWKWNIAFNDRELLTGDVHAPTTGNYEYYNEGNVIFRRDFDPYNTFFVPAPDSIVSTFMKNGDKATYYSSVANHYNDGVGDNYLYPGGYWKRYNSTYSGWSLRGEFNSWSGTEHNFVAESADDSIFTTSILLYKDADKAFRLYKNMMKNGISDAYTNYGDNITYVNSHQARRFTPPSNASEGDYYHNTTVHSATEGVYVFKIHYTYKGTVELTIDFPMHVGDYEVLYKDDVKTAWHSTGTMDRNETNPITSLFVRKHKNPVAKWRKCTGLTDAGAITWGNLNDINLSSYQGTGGILENKVNDTTCVYNFLFTVVDNALSLTDIEEYTGDYYIRTDAAGGKKWADYIENGHKMTYSDYADANSGFSHYFMKYVGAGTNVKLVVANLYSPCISDTLGQGTQSDYVNGSDNLIANANIRFSWNMHNNSLNRAYVGMVDRTHTPRVATKFIVLQGQADMLLDKDGNALNSANQGTMYVGDNAIEFDDDENWVYETTVKAKADGRIKIYSHVNGHDYYLVGDSPLSGWTPETSDYLITGTGDDAQKIRVIYDFKTGRLITAWLPSVAVNEHMTVKADVMIVREHQEAADQINMSGAGQITLNPGKTVYGVMRFNKYILNNLEEGTSTPLAPGSQKTIYERSNYYISFPFDVKVSDIFGFGSYGPDFTLRYYDGKGRAKNGYWADSNSFWKYVPPFGTLNANEGYLLSLNMNNFTTSSDVWNNGVENIELYFPATGTIDIQQVSTFDIDSLKVSEYQSTINRGTGTDGDRRVKDSYWRCIGVPSFAQKEIEHDGSGEYAINWHTSGTELPFLYKVNWNSNDLEVQDAASFTFLPMHAYMVQNGNLIRWTNVIRPASVARRATEPEELTFRIELSKDGDMEDQAYVRLTDRECVTSAFDFGQDLTKEFRSDANIYTFIGYERAAANSMPFSESTIVIPMGVKMSESGEYTFAMPDGTHGVSVILVDNMLNTRTNLGLLDYTAYLEAGQTEGRFSLEIAPISQISTDIEAVSDQQSAVRKVMIDGLLYIVKDGKVFDARGAVVK